MRKKLAGIFLALTLGFGGVIAMPAAQPAKADVSSLFSSLTQILSLLGGGNFAAGLAQAIQGIITAIETSQSDILNQMDQLASAQAVACSNDAVLEFADINNFTPDVLQNWAQSATSCVTTIESLWAAIPATNLAQRNVLGIALATVGPIAVAARAKAGLSTAALISNLQQEFTAVKNAFTPYCYGPEPNDPYAEEQMDAGDQTTVFYISTYWMCQSPLYPDSSEPNSGGAGFFTYNSWQDYDCLDCYNDNVSLTQLTQEAGQYNSYGLAVTALANL